MLGSHLALFQGGVTIFSTALICTPATRTEGALQARTSRRLACTRYSRLHYSAPALRCARMPPAPPLWAPICPIWTHLAAPLGGPTPGGLGGRRGRVRRSCRRPVAPPRTSLLAFAPSAVFGRPSGAQEVPDLLVWPQRAGQKGGDYVVPSCSLANAA